jgi:hypothetical protein
MSIFSKLLQEVVDEQELEAVEDTVEEISEPEEVVDELPTDIEEEPVAEESELVASTRDLIDSILDAMEDEMAADGEPIEGSIDIGLELISKYADQIPTEALQSIFDEITTFYETEMVDSEGEEEEPTDDFFEEPAPEEVEEEEITVESILRRK